MTIIDTHAHLAHLENLDDALQSAQENGVVGIVTVGVDLTANKKNLEIKVKTKNPHIYVALGIHPGNINPSEIDAGLQFIREHIKEAIAIGETGLDYWYKWVKKDAAKKAEQRDVFRRQLALAQEFDLPVVIHSRGAWRDCLEMTKGAGVKKAVFHWYSGPLDILEEIIDAGFYVGTTPSLAYSPQSRLAISHAPLERILIETDCPVFFPWPACHSSGGGQDDQGGFKSQPKDVFRTLKAYSQLKNIDEEKALAIFNQNASDFLRISFEPPIFGHQI